MITLFIVPFSSSQVSVLSTRFASLYFVGEQPDLFFFSSSSIFSLLRSIPRANHWASSSSHLLLSSACFARFRGLTTGPLLIFSLQLDSVGLPADHRASFRLLLSSARFSSSAGQPLGLSTTLLVIFSLLT